MKTKKAKWDGERIVELTPKYLQALRDLAKAEIEMMRQQKDESLCPDSWDCCEIEIADLAKSNGTNFTFWSNGDRPKGMKKNFITIKIL